MRKNIGPNLHGDQLEMQNSKSTIPAALGKGLELTTPSSNKQVAEHDADNRGIWKLLPPYEDRVQEETARHGFVGGLKEGTVVYLVAERPDFLGAPVAVAVAKLSQEVTVESDYDGVVSVELVKGFTGVLPTKWQDENFSFPGNDMTAEALGLLKWHTFKSIVAKPKTTQKKGHWPLKGCFVNNLAWPHTPASEEME